MQDPTTLEKPDTKIDLKLNKEKVKPPKKGIYYLNDETTRVEFVIESLVEVFGFSLQSAHKKVFEVHNLHLKEFMVFKAAAPVVKNKTDQLDQMINEYNETLTYEVRNETDEEDN